MNSFEPYVIPPDPKLCEDHFKATSLGIITPECQHFQFNCPCCNLPVNKEPLPLSCSTDSLFFLGTAYPFYFTTYKLLSFLLLAYTFIYFFPAMYLLAKSSGLSIIYILSTQNTFNLTGRDELVSSWLWAVVFNLQQIGIGVWLWVAVKKIEFLRINQESASEYALLLRSVPKSLEEEKIMKILKVNPNPMDEEFSIAKSFWMPDMKEYTQKEEKVMKSLDRKKKALKTIAKRHRLLETQNSVNLIRLDQTLRGNGAYDSVLDVKLRKELQEASEEMEKSHKEAKSIKENYMGNQRANSTNDLLVIYEKAFSQVIVEKNAEGLYIPRLLNECNQEQKGHLPKPEISKAPNPSDIIWENLWVTKDGRFSLVMVHLAATFGLGLACLVFQLCTLPTIIDSSNDWWEAYSVCLAILLLILSYLIGLFVNWSVVREKYHLRSEESTHIFRRIFFGDSFISLVTPFIGLAYAYFSSESDLIESYLSTYKLSFILLIVYSTMLAKGTDLIGWKDLTKFYHRAQVRSSRVLMTQIEANRHFEGCNISFPSKYAYLLKSTLSILFISLLIPIVSLIGTLGMLIGYWTDKYILLRLSKIPIQLNELIVRNCITIFLVAQYILILLRYVILMLSDSSKTIVEVCSNKEDVVCVATILVETVVLLLATIFLVLWIYLATKFVREKKMDRKDIEKLRRNPNDLTFFEARPYFVYDYDRLHPFDGLHPAKLTSQESENETMENFGSFKSASQLQREQNEMAICSKMSSTLSQKKEEPKDIHVSLNNSQAPLSETVKLLGNFGSPNKNEI